MRSNMSRMPVKALLNRSGVTTRLLPSGGFIESYVRRPFPGSQVSERMRPLGSWVNKAKKKGRGPDPQPFFSAHCGTISPFLYLQDSLRTLRQAVDLPSQDEMEDDE